MQSIAIPFKSTQKNKHLLKISFLANTFEYYEFALVAYLASTLSTVFFSSSSPTLALIKTFSLFAVSYLMRPLGAWFFGSLGNKKGSRGALRLSLILMAAPTTLIGLLPAYETIGNGAPLLFLLLRLVQGFGAGGELPLSGCYIFEQAPPHNRGFLCSTAMVGAGLGMLLASFTCTLLFYCFDKITLTAYAWRLPFLLSSFLTLTILHIRNQMVASPPLEHKNKTPLDLPKLIFQALPILAFSGTTFYILFVWMPTYCHHFLQIPQKVSAFANTFALCLKIFVYTAMGWLSDRWGLKYLMQRSFFALILALIPCFLALQAITTLAPLIGIYVILILAFSGVDALILTYLCTLFPPATRHLSVSLSFAIGVGLFGGTAPLICTWLIHQTGWLLAPAFYSLALACFALPVILRLDTPPTT